MFIVYALINDQNRIYVGLTSDFEKRLKEHNSGSAFSTKGYRPWRLFYTKDYSTRIDARIHEKKLKSGYGKEYLKSIIPR